MPKTALAIRRDDMPRREPPVTVRSATECDAPDHVCAGESPPLSPRDKRDDAVLAGVQAEIAAGKRLAEVAKRLKALRLRKTQLLGSDVSRRRNLYVQIEKIITFAETGG